METTLVEKLKLACNQFYLGKDLDKGLMSDKEFDELRKVYESENGSVKNLVDWDTDITMENEPMEALEKSIAGDNDLTAAVADYITENQIQASYCNYKYDGSSIKAYYKNGVLEKILGTPDVKFGFVRTKAFWNLFPHKVDSSIKSIQGEVLVDAGVYGQLARNKANGLTNSKWKDDEVESEAFIRVYNIQFVDGEWTYARNLEALVSLPEINIVRTRPTPAGDAVEVTDKVFAVATRFQPISAPKDAIIKEENGLDLQVDGVVMYSSKGVHGFKFYYTESAIVRIKNIEWNHQSSGSYVPKLEIETAFLNEKYINRVASGGVPNLIGCKMGKGALVRVILANMTIPKVIEVLEESEDYQYPVCECGYQFSEKDIFGSSLKCQNMESVCDYKFNRWYFQMMLELIDDENARSDKNSFEDFFRAELYWFTSYINIDRWDSYDKAKFDKDADREIYDKVCDLILNIIDSQDDNKMREIFRENWNFSDLNWYNMDINVKSWLAVVKKIKEDWNKISEDYREELHKWYDSVSES